MKTVLMTDSCCDLPYDYIKENNIVVLPLTVHLKGEEIPDDLGNTLDYKTFYKAIREGELPTTSQINAYTFEEAFTKYSDEGHSVIYIGISSALSGCVNSAYSAQKEIRERNPKADITVIDSLSASLGLGLLVYHANEFLKEGKSNNFIADWVEHHKLKVNHWFTVEDLGHLYRGGRVSKTAATLGTLLNIKPILQVNDTGHLVPVSKTSGRKKSLKILLDKVQKGMINPEEHVVFISHGDCEEEILDLQRYILEELKVKKVITNTIGAVVGAHAGPGTVALFYLGDKR